MEKKKNAKIWWMEMRSMNKKCERAPPDRNALASGISTAHASKRFRHFKPETENKNRQADIRHGPAIKRILEAWHSLEPDFLNGIYNNERYGIVEGRLSGISARQSDINAFISYLKSCELDYYSKIWAGNFLSALVNAGCEKRYRLDLRSMAPLDSVAYKNSKRLVVLCDEGGNFASCNSAQVVIHGNIQTVAAGQTSGKTIVHGNCRNVASGLEGGGVIVHGIVECVGTQMQDGYVRIKGRVGALGCKDCVEIGRDMEDGTISVDSYDPEPIQGLHALGGRIYVAGFLIFDNGTQFLPFKRGQGQSWEEILENLKLWRKAGFHL